MTGPIRILLAEDSLFVQQVAMTMLNRFGCRVETVADGGEAIAALERESYDLVLMDLEMPGMGGLEATRQIRSGRTKARNPNIPIVAMTANAQESDRELCRAAGMDDYLSKPFVETALAASLKKWWPEVGAQVAKDGGESSPEREAMAGSAIFDRADLLARLGNPQVVDKLIAMFIEQLPPEIELLKTKVAADNIADAWGQAHKIKGMAANASCRALSAMALEMEKAGKTDNLAAMRTILPWLEKQFWRAQAEMSKDR